MSTEPVISRERLIASDLCIGCGACAAGERDGGMGWDRDGQLKPQGSAAWRRQSDERLSRTCPFSPLARDEDVLAAALFPDAPHRDPLVGRWDEAYVGGVREGAFRANGSSGGMVTWVAAELLRRGLVDGVAHVGPRAPGEGDGRLFGYRLSRTPDELNGGAKSRYYPVEMSQVLEAIRTTPGRYAVVGVPCFIKAVQLLRAEDPVMRERVVFTLGLFCGHSKSARMVESFAWQMDVEPAAVERIDYRLKNPDRPANWYTAQLALANGETRTQDWWHLVDGDWGSGFFQNAACNYCDDVTAETADVSFGDAWLEPYSSDGRGTNVVVARSPAIRALIQEAGERLDLEPVDRDFVVATQAAGFRHRRQGLAWRLERAPGPIQPRKRVAPGSAGIAPRRRAIYRIRRAISRWSHRVFRVARRLNAPRLYIGWGRAVLPVYHALAYSRGRLGKLADRIWPAESG